MTYIESAFHEFDAARHLQPSPAMKVGIPIWDDRVSPVLDVARRLLVVSIEGGAEVGRTEVDLAGPLPGARALQIRDLGVDVLISGAVSQPLEAALLAAGVRVIPQTCGPVERVLRAYLCGRLADDALLMPGCCGRRRRMRGRRRAGGRGRVDVDSSGAF
jgi:predicted Fe-Mo cluster-binding NifX family protein